MAKYVPISRDRFENLRWKRFESYQFAEGSALVPLVVAELPKALLTYPIAFIKNDESYQLVAVLSLHPSTNLFIAEDGRWLGGYVPSFFRSYPFRLMKIESGEFLLCVDEESGLIGEHGERFFDDNGERTEAIDAVLNFLQEIEKNNFVTNRAIDLLSSEGLIEPWNLVIRTAADDQRVDGLYKLQEERLTDIHPNALKEMVEAGALLIGYGQIMSMQNLSILSKLSKAHSERKAQMESLVKSSFESESNVDLSIDWSIFEK